MPHDQGCRSKETNVLELNYEVVIIFGVFPALITAFVLVLGLVCAPYLAYALISNWRQEHRQRNTTRNMLTRLFRTKYDQNVFKSQEACMICLVNFDEDSMVTPLPCDIRHYFHTNCIEQWLEINPLCPLCKSPVTPEEIERVASLYQKMLDHHDFCCSEHSPSRSPDSGTPSFRASMAGGS